MVRAGVKNNLSPINRVALRCLLATTGSSHRSADGCRAEWGSGNLSPFRWDSSKSYGGSGGGRRKKAGRKPKDSRKQVSHKARPQFDKTTAVHVSLRVALHVWNLRSQRCFGAIEKCLEDARER